VTEDPETKNLTLKYEDLDTGELGKYEVEMLVLATGVMANDRNKRLAKTLKIELDELGYFKEKDPLLLPLETQVEGIYLCGGATGPIDIAESVAQATAASMKAVLEVGSRNDLKWEFGMRNAESKEKNENAACDELSRIEVGKRA
jgi:heterodisulfide reductase subunit A